MLKMNIFYIIILSLLNLVHFQIIDEPIHKCGTNNLKIIPKIIEGIKTTTSKRSLDGDDFKEFNIYIDMEDFENELTVNNLSDKRNLFVQGITKAINAIKKLLKVKRLTSEYTFEDSDIQHNGINSWNKSIIGTNMKTQGKGLRSSGYELIIFVKLSDSTRLGPSGPSTLAAASPLYLSSDNQPIIGLLYINKDIDYSKINSLEYFTGTVLHEVTHILGFVQSNFNHFHFLFNQTGSDGIVRNYLASPKLIQVAKNYFNCDSITGVALEDYGGEGTASCHWDARILLGEYMNGVSYSPDEVISEFTLAVLEDFGFYKPNYYTGGLMQYGKNKGCDFVNSKCMNNQKINPNFSNEFFEKIYQSIYPNFNPSCSSSRQSRGYNYLSQYFSIPDNVFPPAYRYFGDKIGGWIAADFCPVSREPNDNSAYYIGNCKKGTGEYGSLLQYNSGNTYKSSQLVNYIKEEYTDKSFCVLSSLITKDAQSSLQKVRAACYQMSCSDLSLTIKIGDYYIVCPRAGGKIKSDNFNGYLTCPDYYLICSGTVLCNDMIDCVEKESLLKTNINYDYTSKTKQDLEAIESEQISQDAYELSTNGICPKDCVECIANTVCLKCRSNYGILSYVEGGSEKHICLALSELNAGGYYKTGSIYHPCRENCIQCTNSNDCSSCKSNYHINNNECIQNIPHCIEYNANSCTKCDIGYKVSSNNCIEGVEHCLNEDSSNHQICNQCENDYRKTTSGQMCYRIIAQCNTYEEEGEECSSCVTDYAFEGDDRTTCKHLSNFNSGFYTEDSGTSYYRCSDIINNCLRCDSSTVCTECNSNYILVNDETNICYNKLNYNMAEYFNVDSYHIKKCSLEINNCKECSKNDGVINCSKCNPNFFFINNNYQLCKHLNDITPSDEYYLDSSGLKYLSCSSYSIDHCKKCQGQNLCTLCTTDYTFIDGDKSLCKAISELDTQQYVIDPNDVSMYRKCDYFMSNCQKCTSANTCIECGTEYGIFKDQSFCVLKTDNHYYLNSGDNYYYSCSDINHCDTCSSGTDCTTCVSGYELVGQLCLYIVEYCDTYDGTTVDRQCTKCQNGYAFEEDQRLQCKNLASFMGTHYTEDEGISYKKCSNAITNCNKCNNKDLCNECFSNYAMIDDAYTTCTSIEPYRNNKKYYFADSSHIKTCSKEIEKCDECSDKNTCTKCINDYIRINNDKKTCLLKSGRNLTEYYTEPNDNNMYLHCSLLVSGCSLCNFEEKCKLCKFGHIMINDEHTKCYEKTKINLDMFFPNAEGTMYYSCEEVRYKSNIKCFSINKNQDIALTFIQLQKKYNKLYCFMKTNNPLPKYFSIKMDINVYSSKRLRNLEEGTPKTVVLTTEDDSNGSIDKAISFVSQDTFSDSENIIAKKISFNDDDITKTVTDNNNVVEIFDSESLLTDTGYVNSLIEEGKLPDLTNPSFKLASSNIDQISINEFDGCNFKLNSEDKISFKSNKIEIEFVEIENTKNHIVAECDTEEKNVNEFDCEIDEKANSDYTFLSRIIVNEDNLLYINQNDKSDKFKIKCEKKNKLKIIIIIVSISLAVAIAIVITIICICKKKSTPEIPIKEKPTNEDLKRVYSHNQRTQTNRKFQDEFNVVDNNTRKRKSAFIPVRQRKSVIKKVKRRASHFHKDVNVDT